MTQNARKDSSLPLLPFDIFYNEISIENLKTSNRENLNCREPCETPASTFEGETMLYKYSAFRHFLAAEPAATCPNVLPGNKLERTGELRVAVN